VTAVREPICLLQDDVAAAIDADDAREGLARRKLVQRGLEIAQ
jgi:hypothetical protein